MSELRRNVPLRGLVSFEDVAVTFTWEEWQDLSDAQRTLFREVMLETYSSLVSLDVQTMDDLIKVSQENQGKHLWQVLITNNKTSTEEITDLQRTFYSGSIHISKLIINNGKCSEMMPEEFHVGKNMLPTWESDEIHVGKKSEGPNAIRSPSYPKHHVAGQTIPTVEQPFEFSEQGKAFNKETVFFTPRKAMMGETTCKYSGTRYGKLADVVQESCHLGEMHNRCKQWRELFLEKPIELILQSDVEDEHKHSQSWRFIGKKRTPLGRKKIEYNACGKTVCKSNNKNKQTGEKSHECLKSFQKSTLRRQRILTRQKPYECKECWKTFFQKSALDGHQKTHTGEKRYKCEECRKTFHWKSAFIRHQRTHTGEKPYECQECRKTFSQKPTLTVHQRTHTGEKPYQCQECRKTFYGKSSLTRHLRTHTGEKPYECQECRKTFSQKPTLIVHQRTHTGEKPYECKICRKNFYSKSELTKHQRIHTGEKPFECKVCRKAFYQKSSLTAHQKIHIRVKPYECQECRKTFHWKSTLARHQRTHTVEKPYECQECRKTFHWKSTLARHQRTHTVEKPYECQECRITFCQKSDLSVHQRTHERDSVNVKI
ncbi:PREDICTED: zinc finger protein 883-like isoform X2 [Condylura cristata]|uniref:zinc finger protein 883-like isoform X2 n=1 Tax=Condylura cristata TaxID=143302 RepID=UPI000642959A|nr:PREDICTED: zinc finger protein 883-like isoform X2 [Condylura cristata]